MDRNPLDEVIDRPIEATPETVAELSEFLSKSKFLELPGIDNEDEKKELSDLLDGILNSLIEGLAENPTKKWVMQQFCLALEAVEDSDTEVRDHFGDHLELIMDILEIESSDGILGFYLGYV
jgi:hypothetical protein